MESVARFAAILLAAGLIALPIGEGAAPANTDSELESRFTTTVRPLINSYCVGCHSGATPAGQLKLDSYFTMSSVVHDFSRWTRVMQRLSANEMPPAAMPQPAESARQQVVDWIGAVRKNEARKNDGDPGVVLARRLSNSEYNYSIRDLTGQDIRPAKEFPVDPANQAGFDNSGESLDMSPALLNKYLLAAREVADHMYLKPDGFEFAPHPMLAETDRDKLSVQRIIDFYDQQDTDFGHYFQAAWRYKHRAVFGEAKATLNDVAVERKVSPKYLATVWQALNTPEDVGPMARLQAMWRALPVPTADQPEIAAIATVKMRDYVERIRKDTFTVFASPTVPGDAEPDPDAPKVVIGGSGLSATSQPLMNWRNREFATHRRDFDKSALRVAGEPPPPVVADASPMGFGPAGPGVAAGRGGRGAIANLQPAPATVQVAGATPAAEQPAAGPARAGAGIGRGGAVAGRGAAGASGRGGGFGRGPSPAALLAKARQEDPDLDVPAGERARYEAAFARFSSVFPDAFYIRERGRAYPFDNGDKGRLLSSGFHLVEGYTRDDIALSEMILDEKGQRELDALWGEFEFVADYTARTFIQFYFNQSGEVEGHGKESGSSRPPDKEVTSEAVIMDLKRQYLAKAEGYPEAQKAIEYHFDGVNATIRGIEKARLEAEPKQLDQLMKFAARAYRRPLTPKETAELLSFYHSVRDKEGLSHEDALRDVIVSVLMSPSFCYRIDLLPSAGTTPTGRATGSLGTYRDPASRLNASPVKTSAILLARTAPASPAVPLPDYALASRLSYFLWSSMPDDELLAHAAAGDLAKPAVLMAQTRRMLKDDRALALATEFGGNWLGFRRFEEINTVDRDRFPSFNNDLREAMFQEPVRFIDDEIHNDRSVLDMLYGKYTFVNPVLAKHYGMPEVPGDADHWVRMDNANDFGRGGLLTMAVFMTQNAPGLRTSPVKRGHWLVRNVLGEVIPPPPAVVPELPKDEAKMDLPLREILAQHRANPVCGACHSHFDVFGLTMEGYGPIGEKRANDLAGHPVDTEATFPGGSHGSGVEGLQAYIRASREQDFIDNLCREMLVYGIGRSLMISDDPLVGRMSAKLAANGYKFDTLIEAIVTSPQFLNRRNPSPEKGN